MIDQEESVPKTPFEVSKSIRKAYSHYRGLGGLMAKARPLICPFEEVLARIPVKAKIIDVGCGVGSLSVVAANCNLIDRGYGIDVAPRAIKVARGARQEKGGKIDFKVMKPGVWPNEVFNTVLCVDVLHHVKRGEQGEFLSGLIRLTDRGGNIILKDISPRPVWKAAANMLHDLIVANQIVHYRPEEAVSRWLARHGMNIREVVRLDRLWYSHYLIVAKKK